MDAWYFPLSESTYEYLKDQNILSIHTETFFSVVPFFYRLEDKFKRLRDNNKHTMKTFMIEKTDHLCVSDFVFTFGSLFKLAKIVKMQECGKAIIELHEIIISLFIEGESTEKIIEVSNKYAVRSGLYKKGVKVVEESRLKSTRNSW